MRKKILWTLQLILMGVLTIYAVFSSQIFYNRMVADTADTLASQIERLDLSALSLRSANVLSLKLSGNRITMISLDGEVIDDSAQGATRESQSGQEEVRSALVYRHGYDVRANEWNENTVFYCERLNFSDGEGLLRVALPMKTQSEMFGDMIPTLVWFVCLAFLICLVFTYLGTEFIISPVKRLAKDAALNLEVDTKYAELKPVVEILNKRNEEVGRQMQEISEEKELVVRAQKSKNDFIANITHEMNTPLTSIRGYSELIQNGVFNEEETRQAAEILVKQSERLTKLIARIINYNELDNDDLPSYDVDLSQSAKEVLETLAPSLKKKNITLFSEIEEGVIVQSRQERVNEILGNLLRNSIRYNKEGGDLTVTIKRAETGKPRLTIADTGIGIAEENLERIFDRFFTVDKAHNGQGGGFGLGLAVVKKICKRAGWEIRVESKLGEGTTFTLDFK